MDSGRSKGERNEVTKKPGKQVRTQYSQRQRVLKEKEERASGESEEEYKIRREHYSRINLVLY